MVQLGMHVARSRGRPASSANGERERERERESLNLFLNESVYQASTRVRTDRASSALTPLTALAAAAVLRRGLGVPRSSLRLLPRPARPSNLDATPSRFWHLYTHVVSEGVEECTRGREEREERERGERREERGERETGRLGD